MNFEEDLRDALADPVWALPVPPDALEQLRVRHRARRRRRMVALGVAGCIGLLCIALMVVALTQDA